MHEQTTQNNIHFSAAVQIGPCIVCSRSAQEHIVKIDNMLVLRPLCSACLALRERRTLRETQRQRKTAIAMIVLVGAVLTLGIVLGLLYSYIVGG